MRTWLRFVICGAVGIVAGIGVAGWSIRSGVFGSGVKIGPWTSGTDYGTAQADAKTRAVVALRGILALPASEARYYNAAIDDTGQPLDGRCRYRLSCGALPVKWWSITVYDPAGYLVPNNAGIYSVGSAALGPDEQARWNVVIAPDRQPGHWVPTGGIKHFEITLRAYLPADGGHGNLARTQLPAITRESCT